MDIPYAILNAVLNSYLPLVSFLFLAFFFQLKFNIATSYVIWPRHLATSLFRDKGGDTGVGVRVGVVGGGGVRVKLGWD